MYGNNHEKKLTQRDMELKCENIRKEFEEEIDFEHRRINVDSAKKKAVLFHYDYEGFRQMVLGANLYTIKSKELSNFELPQQQNQKVLNYQLNKYTPTEADILQMETQFKQIQCQNFRDFRTLFSKEFVMPLNDEAFEKCYTILQAQQPENLKQIFSIDFQINYFFQILEVFKVALEKKGSIFFIVGFLEELSKIKDFMMSIRKFLKKSEKLELNNFIELLHIQRDKQIDVTIEVTDNFQQSFDNIMQTYKV